MSQFNVHEWNYKRRLAEIEDRLFTGQSSERQEQALEDLASAIEELEMSGVFDDGNKAVEFMLNKAYNMLSKKLNIDSDLNEQELTGIDAPEAIETPGNPLYDLNNNDRDVATLNGLIDKYGLKAVQLWITSGEYGRDY
jgi:hypothetical protein